MSKRENSMFSQAKALEVQHQKDIAAVSGTQLASDLDKVKVNLSLIRKNQERLKAEAKRRGVTVSGLITMWIEENCV